ncbi:hypothetical protein ACP3T3_03885 [Chryseobacterium sp. CBSDS_008]|uniref:hypothetical protein n=1 Tax=Chryseobacterium sp. CBSDS_008 TaxID=3415265 RepID=UPI003CEA089A
MCLFGIIGVFANGVAGKMLNKNVAGTTAIFLSGTILVLILLYFSDGNVWATIAVIGIWRFCIHPAF